MNDGRQLELVEQFLMFIGQIIRGMDAIFRKELEAFEVTWPQFHMMKMVSTGGPHTVTELSNILMIAPWTASRMIDGLCNKDLLAKEKDLNDQRVTYIQLTGKSEELLRKLLDLQDQVMSQVFEGEDPEELKRTILNLNRIGSRWLDLAERKAAGEGS